jgi:hypothetical protein
MTKTNQSNNKNNNNMKNNNTKSILPVDLIDYLESYYETHSTLPTPVLECNFGSGSYTAFGTNLKTKVEKAGGIRNLLTTFVGRGARKTINATLEKRVKATRKKPTITVDGEVVVAA